jgi:hypothetical protein
MCDMREQGRTAFTTSMITPPLSICASPTLTANVPFFASMAAELCLCVKGILSFTTIHPRRHRCVARQVYHFAFVVGVRWVVGEIRGGVFWVPPVSRESRASPRYRPREDGLGHPADTSRTNLAVPWVCGSRTLTPAWNSAGASHLGLLPLRAMEEAVVRIKVAFGRDTHELSVTLHTRVDTINTTLAGLTGVPPRSQKLIFKGEDQIVPSSLDTYTPGGSKT